MPDTFTVLILGVPYVFTRGQFGNWTWTREGMSKEVSCDIARGAFETFPIVTPEA